MYITLQKFASYPFAILFLFIQRLISPFLLIRLSYFNADRIGNLYQYYWYACQEDKGKGPKKFTLDLFLCSEVVANEFWTNLYFKKIHLFKHNLFLARVMHLNGKLPDSTRYVRPALPTVPLVQNSQMINNIVKQKGPYFTLSEQEIARGRDILSQIGIPKNAQFICFHNRDSAYLNIAFPNRSASHHDYRDSHIENYLKAVFHMVDKGYVAIRMGALVKEKLKLNNPMVFDYPSSSIRSDFMDVYLGSQCKLFICSDTGMSIIPELFDVPAVYANIVPLARVSNWIKRGLFIPKRFYSKKLKRDLTFQEILSNNDLTATPETKAFIKEEIELIENTPEEILSLTEEMLARLEGTWCDTGEMKELQEKFWALAPYIKTKSKDYNISSTYLVANKHLFGLENA